ncbi:MAG TPA: hypothetical protein EYG57_17100 [Planctomycetes bacterium]|nr:hypothetical protein [Planctomycetota bacterium]
MTLTMTSRAVAWRLVLVGCLAGVLLPMTLKSETQDDPQTATKSDGEKKNELNKQPAPKSTGTVRSTNDERRRKLWEDVEVSRARLRKKAVEAWKNDSGVTRRAPPVRSSVHSARPRIVPAGKAAKPARSAARPSTAPKPSILRQPTRISRDFGGSTADGPDGRTNDSPDVTLELRSRSGSVPSAKPGGGTTIRQLGPRGNVPAAISSPKATIPNTTTPAPLPRTTPPKKRPSVAPLSNNPAVTVLKPLDTTQREINRVPVIDPKRPKNRPLLTQDRKSKVVSPRSNIQHRSIVSRPAVPSPRSVTAIPLTPRGRKQPVISLNPKTPPLQLVTPGFKGAPGALGGVQTSPPNEALPTEPGRNELLLADNVNAAAKKSRVVFTITDDGIESVEIPLTTQIGSIVRVAPMPADNAPRALASVDPANRPRPVVENVKPVTPPVRVLAHRPAVVRAAKSVDLRPAKPAPAEIAAKPGLGPTEPPKTTAAGPAPAPTPSPDRIATVRSPWQSLPLPQGRPKNPRTNSLAHNDGTGAPRRLDSDRDVNAESKEQASTIRPMPRVERRPGLLSQNAPSTTSSRRKRPYDRNSAKSTIGRSSGGHLLALNEPTTLFQPRSVQAHSSAKLQSKPMPSVAKSVPSVTKPMPAVLKPLPSVAKSVPSITKPMPSVLKPLPSKPIQGTKPTPSVAKSVPSVTKPLPSVSRPVVQNPKPVPTVVKPVPTAPKPTPSAVTTNTSPSDVRTGPKVTAPPVIALNAAPNITELDPQDRILAEPQVTHHRLQLQVNQSGLLRLPNDVEKVTVIKKELCNVILFENRQVSIIAKKAGTTHMMLTMKGEVGTTNYLISITPQKVASQQADSYSKLEQAIHQMFPAAVVTIGEERGRITVTGEVDSNDEAFKILALVRQVHLVPVIDRLTVR